jgi:lysyl-tRNA synthetase class II
MMPLTSLRIGRIIVLHRETTIQSRKEWVSLSVEENVFRAMKVHDQINNVGHVIEGPQICLNITPEEHQEEMKQAAKKARMKIINNLDLESREKLVKQEFQVYRKKKLDQPTLTIPTMTQTKPSPSNLPPPEAP